MMNRRLQCKIWQSMTDEIGKFMNMPANGETGTKLDARKEGNGWILSVPGLPRDPLALVSLVMELGRMIGEKLGDRNFEDRWIERLEPFWLHLYDNGYAPYLREA